MFGGNVRFVDMSGEQALFTEEAKETADARNALKNCVVNLLSKVKWQSVAHWPIITPC